MQIVIPLGQAKTIARIGKRIFGVAAVAVIAGEYGVVAQVLALCQAEPAMAATAGQPGHAHPFPDRAFVSQIAGMDDRPHHFMPQNQGRLMQRQFAVENMQIGTAHTARGNPQQDFIGGWKWNRHAQRA